MSQQAAKVTSKSPRSTSPAGREPQLNVNLGPIICPGHSRPISDLAYSNVVNDEYFLISASLDKNPMLRRGGTGDWIGTFSGHKGAVWSARLNSDNSLAVTAAADFTVKLWNGIKGSEIREYAHKHIVKSAVFSLDSRYIFTGGHEKKVRVFDVLSEKADPILVLEGHSKNISNVVSIPDQQQLIASSGDDSGIRIWDFRTGGLVKQLPTPGPVTSLEVSFASNTFTVATGNSVQFWNTTSFELLKTHTMERDVKCASLHPNRSVFVAGSISELWARVYNYETGEEITCQKGHHGPVRCIAFSPMGDAYASGSEDGTIRIWEHAATIA